MISKINKKGFTLIESILALLILSVILSLVWPMFMSSIEISREKTDVESVRNALSECRIEALNSANEVTKTVYAKQTQNGWQELKDDNVNTPIRDFNGLVLWPYMGYNKGNGNSSYWLITCYPDGRYKIEIGDRSSCSWKQVIESY